jgi:hypothetical protein
MLRRQPPWSPFVKGECGQIHGVRRGAALPASATENRKLKTENQCSSASVFICVHPSSSVQRSPVAGPTTLRQIGNRWAVRQCVGGSNLLPLRFTRKLKTENGLPKPALLLRVRCRGARR